MKSSKYLIRKRFNLLNIFFVQNTFVWFANMEKLADIIIILTKILRNKNYFTNLIVLSIAISHFFTFLKNKLNEIWNLGRQPF